MNLPKNNKKNIFVTTGSFIEFDLLVKIIDNINTNKKYNVVFQIGGGNYTPKNGLYFKFDKNLNKYYKWCDLVITHTGAGTLTELHKKNIKTIAISNPKHYKDVAEIAQKFNSFNYIKFLEYNTIRYNIKLLIKTIEDILSNKIKFKKYKNKKETIGKEILKYINSI